MRLPPAPRPPPKHGRPLRQRGGDDFRIRPAPAPNTPEYLARLVPVERACDASVDAIAETLTQIVEFDAPGADPYSPNPEPTATPRRRDRVDLALRTPRPHERRAPRRARGRRRGDVPAPGLRSRGRERRRRSRPRTTEKSKFCVFVGVFEGVALVTVTRDWDVTRGYRVREMAEREEARREGAEHAAAETTGGGGYP